MNALGIIRKISIGDIKEGLTYKMHQPMMGGRIVIEQIMRDLEAPANQVKYDIFVCENGSDNLRLWKSFINEPTAIEYDISVDETA